MGRLHSAVVLDLSSRWVVGCDMDKRMKAKLVCDALQMALWRQRIPSRVLIHSDRGRQHCSRKYQYLLTKHDLIYSKSGMGNYHDNACAETSFHTLVVEMIHGESFSTRDAMRRAVFEYFEVDYNRTRKHIADGHISPLAYVSGQAQRSGCSGSQ